jgi:hypothetical protein
VCRNRVFSETLFTTPQNSDMQEKTGERKLRVAVERQKGIAIKIFSQWFTGLPDRLVLMPGGRVYWVELKTTGKKPSPRQEVVIAMLRRLGFEVWVIDTDEILEKFLSEIQK